MRSVPKSDAEAGLGYASPVLKTLLLLALLVFGIRRLSAGYAPAPPGLAVLHRGEAAFVRAAAEVLFPDGGAMPVAGVDAQLPNYIDRHLSALPASKRWQIRALFLLIEQLPLAMPGEEPGGRARFSNLSAASRVALLGRLAEHEKGLFRILFIALRGVLALGYLGHPANLRALGLAPFAIAPAVSDAELLFPRVGGLPSSIGFGLGDKTTDVLGEPLDPDGPREKAYLRGGQPAGERS